MIGKLNERELTTIVFELAGVSMFYLGTVAALMYNVAGTAGYFA